MEDKYKKVEYVNSDGTRNWEANILFDNIKRLEQENAELKEKISKNKAEEIGKETYLELKIKKYKQALEEIRGIYDWRNEYNSIGIDDYKKIIEDIENKINEVLGNE